MLHRNRADAAIHSASTRYFGNSHVLDTSRWMASRRCFTEVCVESSTWYLVCSVSWTKLCVQMCRPVDSSDLTGQIHSLWLFAGFLSFFMAVTRWDEFRVYTFRNRLRSSKPLTGLEMMSEESYVVHPWWCPLFSCQICGFVMVVYSSQLIITYRSWRLYGCAWSMTLPWPRSLESVGLLDLCRKIEIRKSGWLYFEYTRTKQVTPADIIRAFTTISNCSWSLSIYPLTR